MSQPIEDYALIGDCHTAALVGRNGSIDWLCLPEFDGSACFAALLGSSEHGRWQIAPKAPVRKVTRQYRPGTLILETQFETDQGVVTVIDFMPPRTHEPTLVRVVRGQRNKVSMHMELVIRFDYGSIVPWVRRTDQGIVAIGGPDSLYIDSSVEMRGENLTTVADFDVAAGEDATFVMTWSPSHFERRPPIDPVKELKSTEQWWNHWWRKCAYEGPHQELVHRSLITLKALTYSPTGGIVAAATTSLPEKLGSSRNWDYRFCWLRDATFTLYALMLGGFTEEAIAWRDWLLRTIAGDPEQLNIMYGLHGERRLTELELDWLPGYHNSRPVRIGNAAWSQFQLDVFGEVCDALHAARSLGVPVDENVWALERQLGKFLEKNWKLPDEGIWEVRGPRRNFVHSKMMAWVAFDRMVKAIERFQLKGPLQHWRTVRDEIHAEVCRLGYNEQKKAFVQYYGSQDLDASLLMMPLVGFLPPTDPRVISTVDAIQRELTVDGFVLRYRTDSDVDGLPEGEGAFLPCSFWLADNLNLLGRHDEACELFEQLASLANDVGLFAEEYDPHAKRFLGNFPQAFTHVALVNSAFNLWKTGGPAEHRNRD